MNSVDERQLVERARREPEAFGALFDLYYPRIFSYVLKRLGNVQTAEDLSSGVFFKAMDKLWQFQWRDVSFSAWLYAIATNELRQHFRSHRHRVLSLEQLMEERGLEWEDPVNVFEEMRELQADLDRHEEFLKVHAVLKTLPLKYQEVLTLRFLEDKKIAEIAEILGKREGTVKSLLSRGSKILKGQFCNVSGASGIVLHGEASPTF